MCSQNNFAVQAGAILRGYLIPFQVEVMSKQILGLFSQYETIE